MIATETHRGEYENGIFHPGKPEFRIRYIIDEENRKITRTEVIRLRNKELQEDNTVYTITNYVPNSLLKKGQKIINAVGIPGIAATELIEIGDKFFYYTKAIEGVVYMSYGNVKKYTFSKQ